MTDLEMTRLCAMAMKLATIAPPKDYEDLIIIAGLSMPYAPLHDDAQAMALEDWLIERGYLHYEDGSRMFYSWPLETSVETFSADFSEKAGRRRVLCECVVKVQQAKS